MSAAVNVEDKLFQNRYKVDHGRPHIQIKDAAICANDCAEQQCTYVCPAACFRKTSRKVLKVGNFDGCLECGSCRVICTEHTNVAWEYPRGGHGILFKFG